MILIVVGGWALLAAATAATLSALKGRQRLTAGREILAERGMTDYRYTTGEHAGRWASEVLVDDLEFAAEARGG